jgi:hypothetical protein
MKPIIAATATPLASIFGSGFLVIVPILAGSVGSYSVLAMVAVCALAFAVGSVIRFNIKNAEPVLAGQPGEATLALERSSDLALVIAYVVSVCLYLHILSAFVLGGLNADAGINEDLLTSAVIILITIIGVVRGLDVLDSLEEWALYVTLAIIAVLIVGFGVHDWSAWQSPSGLTMIKALDHTPWEVLTILAGTLIVVQGFETPRYLGDRFPADLRIRASRWAQIFSTIVYVAFVALALPILYVLNGKYDDDSLIALVRTVSALLVVPLIIAAAMSQFSAAVADTLAATGNLKEATHGHIGSKWGCLFVGGGALALTWSGDTYSILALASRAFAFYYLMQCLVAISVSRSMVQRLAMALLAIVLGFITIFAVPAS